MHAILPGTHRPPVWAVPLAFTLVYLAWGTTYLAIRWGVKEFPPALFGGIRVGLAGLVLLAYVAWRGESVRLARREFLWAAFIGTILFTGGNLLVTMGEKYVASSVAAVLVATTPLWMALIETFWPSGEHLSLRGWLGVLAGLAGVLLLFAPKLHDSDALVEDAGALLVLGSACAWALGSFLLRRQRARSAHLTTAAYQMIVGGLGQTLIGVAAGEPAQLTADRFTLPAVYAFFHLLVVGSLVGFVAYTWLLGHVTVTQAGTYAYVNPIVAILVGWLLGGETISGWIVGGMACILAGVALVRGGGSHGNATPRTADQSP
ncbi:MAG: EamA family transporter [Gemmataceae bacterium]|nr:EamA family transporter [Gemmataceae bacterium]